MFVLLKQYLSANESMESPHLCGKNVSSVFCLETKTNVNTLEDGKELKRIAETHLSNLLEMTGY